MKVPQLIIDSKEIRCPDLKHREFLEGYLEQHVAKEERSILSTAFYPDDEESLSKILLVEVHTIERRKTAENMILNLQTILEGGSVQLAKTSDSIRNGSEDLAEEVTEALKVWNDVFSALEVLEGIKSDIISIRIESLLRVTTMKLDELNEALDNDDSAKGAKIFGELATLAVDWVEAL